MNVSDFTTLQLLELVWLRISDKNEITISVNRKIKSISDFIKSVEQTEIIDQPTENKISSRAKFQQIINSRMLPLEMSLLINQNKVQAQQHLSLLFEELNELQQIIHTEIINQENKEL